MEDFVTRDKSNWSWTLMIRQPDHLSSDAVKASIEEIKAKKDPPALSKVRFEAFNEGLSVQIMHLGSFDAEGPAIARMHEFIDAEGYVPNGRHHEIYLSDFTRTAPEKLRTILRQPIRKQ
jgi:hypothetical protein